VGIAIVYDSGVGIDYLNIFSNICFIILAE
jgi:hypothetical protein